MSLPVLYGSYEYDAVYLLEVEFHIACQDEARRCWCKGQTSA